MDKETPSFAAQVVIPGVPKALSYALKKNHRELAIGAEVIVPLGSRKSRGWMIGKTPLEESPAGQSEPFGKAQQMGFLEEKQGSLRFIDDAFPCFDASQLKLFEWMSIYYGYPLVEIIENAIPRKSHSRPQKFIKLRTPLTPEQMEALRQKAPLQAKIVETLTSCELPVSITELESISRSVRPSIKALEKNGILEILSLTQFQRKLKNQTPLESRSVAPTLTPEQKLAYKELESSIEKTSFEAFLLLGVTGSGKTEVYLRAIEKTLSQGGSALLIVPEIALTPQLFDVVQARLNTPVAILHSQVGASERWSAWEALLSGQMRVAIGARSAIFAPMKQLSLIIVDEEHEQSYKQSDGVRYHGRDVAVMRAKYSQCPIVLGSATPSFESLLNVKKGRYKLLEMTMRATSRPVPSIELVDIGKIRRKDMPSENLSPQLYQALGETLERSEQSVILYNRRGFSSYLQCDSCRTALSCPQCSITLTYHKGPHQLLCHYCNISLAPPEFCSLCRDPRTTALETKDEDTPIGRLSHRGAGTERVIDELSALFPEARIVRMDRDTTSKKDAYRDILGKMRSFEADILVGTQMIAKGHDLPGVTLVGVVDGDIGLHNPDFRSSEKIFQLMTQVAGRAGRGSQPGKVFIQTREPNHPTMVAIKTARFKAFARYQLEQRKLLQYPPWGRMMRIVVSHPDMHRIAKLSKQTAETVKSLITQVGDRSTETKIGLLGPSPAYTERLRGRYRWHILLKSSSASALSTIATELNRWRKGLEEEARISVDIDPVDML